MQEFINFMTSNPSFLGYVWLIVSIVLLIVEIGTPGLFYCISLALGCAVAAPFAFFAWSVYIQCLIALGASALCFGALKCIISNKKIMPVEQKTNADALIGQEGLVVLTIEPRMPGRVKIKGEEWPAIALHGTMFHQGTVVTVVRIEGNKLVVM